MTILLRIKNMGRSCVEKERVSRRNVEEIVSNYISVITNNEKSIKTFRRWT
jgi:hypothetical protein